MSETNQVILMGKLLEDPSGKVSKNGNTYATLALDIIRTWVKDDGSEARKNERHRVTAWGELASLCLDKGRKGMPVYVAGHLTHYSKQDDGGQTRWHTIVNADEIKFISSEDLEDSVH